MELETNTELTRPLSAWLSVGNRIPGALPRVRHGEWSRRDASDMDGLSREAETPKPIGKIDMPALSREILRGKGLRASA